MCPWMKLKHIGSYTFGGSLAALAAIAASPTASVESNSKNYLTPPSKDDKINRQQRRAAKKGK
jgi:predicted ATP-dependent Lon-type protease